MSNLNCIPVKTRTERREKESDHLIGVIGSLLQRKPRVCGVQPNFLLIAVTLPTRLKRKNRSKIPSDWNFMRDAVVIYFRKNRKRHKKSRCQKCTDLMVRDLPLQRFLLNWWSVFLCLELFLKTSFKTTGHVNIRSWGISLCFCAASSCNHMTPCCAPQTDSTVWTNWLGKIKRNLI